MRWHRIAGLGLLAVILGSAVAMVVRSQKTVDPRLEARGREVLHSVAEFYGVQTSFTVTLRRHVVLTVAGRQPKTNDDVMHIAVRRPNRLALRLGDGAGGIFCDGKRLVVCAPELNQYVIDKAPHAVAQIFGDWEARPILAGPIFLDELLQEDADERLLGRVSGCEYIGAERLGDVPCHRVRFYEKNMDWDMWVRTGDRPIVMKIVPDFAREIALRKQSGQPETSVEMRLLFEDWNLEGEVPDETFAFAPPEGFLEAMSFYPLPPERPEPIEGQPAPGFTLKTLDGAEVRLADHRGKQVVVLDFWATTCGPCRISMPLIIRAAGQFDEKDVVLYAVNLDEPPSRIVPFLKEANAEPTVILDRGGQVGLKYSADTGIPLVVVVGKDGVVKKARRGFHPALGKLLVKDIEALSICRAVSRTHRTEP